MRTLQKNCCLHARRSFHINQPMVFNKDLLFIHLGKTGGISVANYLCRVLKPPVVSVVRHDEYDKLKQIGHEIMIPWKRHANLIEASSFLVQKNMQIEDFKVILIVIRNPLDLDYSYYKHLRMPKYIPRLLINPANVPRLEAARKDYLHFAKQQFTHFRGELKDYFEIDGKIPANMKIVFFENLATEIQGIVRPYSISNADFPHRNNSPEPSPRPVLNHEAIESIRRKYNWIYEKNFYPLPKE